MKQGFEGTYLGHSFEGPCLGHYNTPETLVPRHMVEKSRQGMEGFLLIVGGILLGVDEDAMLKMGGKSVFCKYIGHG